VRALKGELTASGRLTVAELTRVCRLFGGDPDTLGACLLALANPAGPDASAMITALTIEEARLAGIPNNPTAGVRPATRSHRETDCP